MTYLYDARGGLTKTTLPGSVNQVYTYDAAGRRTHADDPDSDLDWHVDAASRISKVVDGKLSKTIIYGYDAAGRRTKLDGPESNDTQAWSYDATARLTKITENSSDRGEWLYNLAGQQTKLTYGSGSYSNWNYDASGRLTNLVHKKSGGTVIQSFAYILDKVGNRTKLTLDGGDYIVYDYDPLYQLTKEHRKTSGGSTQYWNEFYYDYISNRTKLRHNDGTSTTTTTYSYNAADQLTKEIAGSTTYTYNFDASGNHTKKDDGTTTEEYYYDARNLLTKFTDSGGMAALPLPQPPTFAEAVPSALGLSATGTTSQEAHGDSDDHQTLSGMQRTPSIPATRYGLNLGVYEPMGLAAVLAPELQALAALSWPEPPTLRKTSAPVRVTILAASSVVVLLFLSRLVFCWIRRWPTVHCKVLPIGCILIIVLAPPVMIETAAIRVEAATATYTYDVLNRRVKEDIDGTVTRNLYDGDNVLAEYDGSATPVLQGSYVAPGLDQYVRLTRSSTVNYHHQDPLGSVWNLTRASDEVIRNTYAYQAFGATYGTVTENVSNPYRFTGRAWDDSSSLNYYRARQYDHRLGRFIGRDPLLDLDAINLYLYAHANPVLFVDPPGTLSTMPIDDILDDPILVCLAGARGIFTCILALLAYCKWCIGVCAAVPIGLAACLACLFLCTAFGGAGCGSIAALAIALCCEKSGIKL